MSQKWKGDDVPDQSGRTILITGGNSGIGFEAARMLLAANADVVLGCRNPEKAQKAVEQLQAGSKGGSVSSVAIDLADLSSVRAFTDRWQAGGHKLDVLINNAGVMALPRCETKDGFEMQFGTNHLGHFALTLQLLPILMEADEPRVVNVSSMAHSFGKMDFDNLNAEKSYSKWGAYGQSKLANLLFTFELQRRLVARAKGGIAVSCHPGYAATNLQSVGAKMQGATLVEKVMDLGNALFAQSAEMGALPTLRAAVDPKLEGGEFIGPRAFGGMRGYPELGRAKRTAYNAEHAQRLWAISEELTETRSPL